MQSKGFCQKKWRGYLVIYRLGGCIRYNFKSISKNMVNTSIFGHNVVCVGHNIYLVKLIGIMLWNYNDQ